MMDELTGKRQILFDAILIRGVNGGSPPKASAAFRILALEQVAFTGF